MRKSNIILIIVLSLILLFIFTNFYSLFKSMENFDLNKSENLIIVQDNIIKTKKIFSVLSIITGLFILGTGVFLIYLFKKDKSKPKESEFTPLNQYLVELKNSENKLKEIVEEKEKKVLSGEELNKLIINNINIGIVYINSNNKIEIFNPESQRIFSQSFANAKNNHYKNILKNFKNILDFIDSAEDKDYGEVEDNDRVYFINVLYMLKTGGRLILIKDITEEKTREENELLHKNYSMIGEISVFLAHEIRNSLSVIYGYAKTIKDNENKVKQISEEIHFLTDMMNKFMEFAKPIKSNNNEEINLKDLFNSILSSYDMEFEIFDNDFLINSDKNLLTSVIQNLIINSIQAESTKIIVKAKKLDNKVEVSFSDNGTGIKEKDLQKIWYPFFTTKDKGSGMGLAIVKKVSSFLNIDISLFSTDENGTTFKLIFN